MSTSHRPRGIVALLLSLLLVAIVAAPASAAKAPKVNVCHYDQVLGTFSLNTVSASSLAKHLAHGDGLPGEGAFDANCQPPPPPARIFAIAWSNLDDVAGYQAGGTDVLIMELEDTNRDNIVSIGDTVIADGFPLDTSASGFGTWGLVSQVVTDADGNGDGNLSVGTATGFVAWAHDTDLEGAAFHSGGGGLSPVIIDWYSGAAECTDGREDLVYTNTDEPLNPNVDAYDQRCDNSDNTFIDVVIDVTP